MSDFYQDAAKFITSKTTFDKRRMQLLKLSFVLADKTKQLFEEFKGATSRITQLEKAGKFSQVCHS